MGFDREQHLIGEILKQLIGWETGADVHKEVSHHEGALLVACSWLMRNDPERPNKRSTPIHIVITRRLVEIVKGSDEEQARAIVPEILEVIGLRMHEYAPDPELPAGAAVDPFEIHVDLVDLRSHFD